MSKEQGGIMQTYTYSEFAAFKRCQLRHHRSYIELLEPKRVTPKPLFVGSAVHAGLAAYYRGEDVEAAVLSYLGEELARLDQDPKAWDEDRVKARDAGDLALTMVTGWKNWIAMNYNSDKAMQVVAIELEFQTSLRTPAGHPAHAQLAGKIDGLVEVDGLYWLLEHKTASKIGDSYLYQLQLDEQVSTYIWAIRRAFKIDVVGCVYNILRSQAPGPRVKAPLFYREFVWRNEQELDAIGKRLYWTYREIERSRRTGLALPNPTLMNCRGCPFWTLCIEDTPEARSLFTKKEQKHVELGEVTMNGDLPG